MVFFFFGYVVKVAVSQHLDIKLMPEKNEASTQSSNGLLRLYHFVMVKYDKNFVRTSVWKIEQRTKNDALLLIERIFSVPLLCHCCCCCSNNICIFIIRSLNAIQTPIPVVWSHNSPNNKQHMLTFTSQWIFSFVTFQWIIFYIHTPYIHKLDSFNK